MKILMHSNAPWTGTGYGEQTALACRQFVADGHDPAVSAFYGLQGVKMDWNGLPIYPGGADVWGNDVITAHALHHFDGDLSAGVIITLMDVWTLVAPSLKHFVVGSWCPVDHDPMPPAVLSYFHRTGATPIAMSKFGVEKFAEADLEALYVPHSIDLDVFQPRDNAREQLGWDPEWFVIGMVAANKGNTPPRKSFPQVFDAFARFSRRHPEARLYLHTEQLGVAQGIDMHQMAAAYGIDQSKILWPDQYQMRIGIPPVALSYLYSAMDVLANPSYGEGFGVPILEAQACGTPVIVSKFTAMTELVGWGWAIDVEEWWDSRHGSFWGYASPKAILKAFDDAYRTRKNTGRRRKALDLAAQYEVAKVYEEHWKPVLAELQKRLPSEAHPVVLDDLAEAFEMPDMPEQVEDLRFGSKGF